MRIKKFGWIGVCILLVVGCQKKEPPVITPSQVLDTYLTAMKAQDGNAMAKVTESGKGDDFTILEEDAASIGLSGEVLQDFYAYLLSFTYTINTESIQLKEDKASVDVTIQTYDILSVWNAGVEAHKDEFGKIKGGEGSDEEKSQQIATILIKEFENAEQSYTAPYTFQFVLVEDTWKLKDDELSSFYQILLNTSLSE